MSRTEGASARTIVGILCVTAILVGTAAAQPTLGSGWGQMNRDIQIGNFWDRDTNRNYGGVNTAFQWPGGWWNNDTYPVERRTYANFKGFVLGAKNVPDPQFPTTVWPYMVGQRDGQNDGEQGLAILDYPPDVINPNVNTQILFKGRLARRTFRQANAVVTVDGVNNNRLNHIVVTNTTPELAPFGDEFDAPYQNDAIDPTIPADLTFETHSWTRMGVSDSRKIYTFVDRRNDDYHFWHWRMINDGIWGRLGHDRVDCCGGTWGTVQGVMHSLMFQWDRASRGANVTGGAGQDNNDSIWRYYGHDYDGTRTEDMRLVYVIDGDQSTTKFPSQYANGSWDDTGDPDPVTGELLSAKTGGWQILHYDVSGTDKHDDPSQPLTLGWINFEYLTRAGYHGMQAKYEQMRWGWSTVLGEYYPGWIQETPGRGRHPHADDLGASWIKSSNHPDSTAQLSAWIGMVLGVDLSVTDVEQQAGFGPDDMAPGDTINGIHVLGVKGLEIPYAQQFGRQWLLGQKTDAEKDALVNSTIDSLFMIMRQAKAVYESGQFGDREASARYELEESFRDAVVQGRLALSPPAPATLTVMSGTSGIELSWSLNTTTGSSIAGWRVYRALANFKGDSAWILIRQFGPSTLSWRDTQVLANYPYYYYLTTFDAQGNESTMFTRTDVPAYATAPVPNLAQLSLPTITVQAGDVVDYPIIATFTDAQSVEIDLFFDAWLLSPEPDFIVDHAFDSSSVAPEWSVIGNRIRVVFASEYRVTLADEPVATLRFRVNPQAAHNAFATFQWVPYPSTNVNERSAALQNGGIRILNRPVGDVDGDGAVSAYDASIVLRYAVHLLTTIEISYADVTGNARVSPYDAAWILMKAVGMVSRFPVEDALAKRAVAAPRILVWSKDTAGWTLAIDDASDLRAGELSLVLPDEQAAAVAGGDYIASRQEGAALHIAFARVDIGGPVLFRIERPDLTAPPHVESVSLNEGLLPVDKILRPVPFALAQNAPNPFNPTTTIRFGLPASGDVQLAVYDPSGRLVRTLVSGATDAGEHVAVWDGRDAAGRPCASGVYLYRLLAPPGTLVRRMILVR